MHFSFTFWMWLATFALAFVVQAIAIPIESSSRVSESTRRRAGAVADRAKWAGLSTLLLMFVTVVIELFVASLL